MIIIYKQLKNGKVELTKKELEELLKKADSEGYNRGYQDGIKYSVYWRNSTQPLTVEGTKLNWTCDSKVEG